MLIQSRFQIAGFWGKPATPPFTLNLIADKEWKGALTSGNVVNLRRYEINKDEQADDDNDKHRAVSLGYKLHSQDNYVKDWTTHISPDEQSLRTEAIEHYQSVIDDILDVLNPTLSASDTATVQDPNAPVANRTAIMDAANMSTDTRSLLWDAMVNIQQLTTLSAWGNNGYLENPPNPFGDERYGLYRTLNTPNIPYWYESNFYLDANRPFTIWLYRFKPNEKQADTYLWFDWGNWRLEFKGDNQAKIYRMNDKLSETDRQALDDQLNAILDGGRLTPDDKAYIAAQKDAIKSLHVTAHTDQRPLTDAEKQQEEQYKQNITARRDQKKQLSQADEDKVKALKAQLFKQETEISLHEQAKTLFNVPLTITLLPQQRGLLSITLEGNDPYTIEDKSITKKRTLSPLWNASKLHLKGNGGALMWKWGYPVFSSKGSLKIPDFSVGFDAGDGSSETVQGYWENSPGTGLSFSMNMTTPASTTTVGSSTVTTPPKYDIELDFISDGTYAPYVYRAQLFIPATARDGSDTVVWDSNSYLDNNVPPILDVQLTYDESTKRRSHEIILRNAKTPTYPNGELNLPGTLHDRVCFISTDGQALIKGIIKDVVYEEMAGAGTARNESTVRIRIQDLWSLLDDDTLGEELIGDGLTLAQHITDVLTGCGLKASELTGIDPTAGKVLPTAGPAESPAIRPQKGTQRAPYIRQLVDRFGMGNELNFDGATFTFGMPLMTIVAAFTTTPATTTERYVVNSPLHIPENWDDFYNYFRVEGEKDPETKKPITAEWTTWESINNPASPFYIGRRKPYPTVTDDGLKTEADVNWTLRSLVKRYSKVGDHLEFGTFFHAELKIGQYITVDGVTCEIVRINESSIAEDTMTLVVRKYVAPPG